MKRRTECAQGGADEAVGRPLAPVIVPSSTFSFEDQAGVERYYEQGDGYVYSRYGNPTVVGAEKLLARLEGAEACAMFSSGMAAISTLFLSVAGAGRRIAAQAELYGGSTELLTGLLPEMGIEVDRISRRELQELKPERLNGCRLLYLETPVNPTLGIIDLRKVAAVASEAGVPVAVDGTFAPPAIQRPLERGVDLVLHSATKYLGGHTDLIGGSISGSKERIGALAERRRVLGGSMDPFTAFLLHRGMRTLAVRMDAHCSGALFVARGLQAHPAVEAVFYPGLEDHPDHRLAREQMDGFGGMVSFTVRGDGEAAVRVHDRLRLFVRAGSLGGVESLVSIPALMSHRHLGDAARDAAGVPRNLIRLSVGLEEPGDLLEDLEQALG